MNYQMLSGLSGLSFADRYDASAEISTALDLAEGLRSFDRSEVSND